MDRFNFKSRSWLVVLASCSLVKLLSAATAQETAALPADPASWVNSPPLTSEALRGKAAFLWFFEENCPRCREKWPELMATAESYRGKPIVFIGVNSGNDRAAIAAYARQNRVTWPILVDPSRQFEQQAGVPEISLQNVHQAKVILPDGRIGHGDWSDIEGTANRALATAQWNIDPAGIPDSLQAAWSGIEFGDYAAAAPLVRKAAASRKPEEKAAGQRLLSYVQQKIDEQTQTAKKSAEAGQPWDAYKAYSALVEQFRGYELPGDPHAELRALADDPAVKKELLARKMLEATIKLASDPRARSRAMTRLKTIVEQHAGTEAAAEAEKMLAQLGAG